MGENSASGLTRCALGGTVGESAWWQGTGRGRVGVPGRLGSLPLGAVPSASRLTCAWWPGIWRCSPGWETGGKSLMAKGNWVSSWSSMDRLENCNRMQQSFIRFIRKSQACSQMTQGREIGKRGTVQWQHNIAAVCTLLLTTMWNLNGGTDRKKQEQENLKWAVKGGASSSGRKKNIWSFPGRTCD